MPLLGIWGEAGCHGSPELTLSSKWLILLQDFSLSKIITPKKASGSERQVWESQPPWQHPCHSYPLLLKGQ